jgi:AcrR family transcriptional regulator
VSESSVVASSGRSERTRVRLLEAGLELFERSGYDQTTVAQIATAAGVTEMTFFRHYATKAHLLLDDPYDPVIVDAVAAQPRGLPVLIRVTRGLAEASRNLPESEMASMRRRLRLAASTPSLDASVRANTSRSEHAVIDQLLRDGATRLQAQVAAAAVFAAVTSGLLHWSGSGQGSLSDVLAEALGVLEAQP